MDVIELNSNSAEEFIRQQPVSVILYFTPQDEGVNVVLARLAEVAGTFEELVRFGTVDLSRSENAEIVEQGIIVATPTVIFYRFAAPCDEVVGAGEIAKRLDRKYVASCGYTDTGLRLLRE
jgi:hypothetical protein